jgi:hypothetical protein
VSRISSAVLCQTNGLGLSFQLVIRVRIEATSSRRERWLPRLVQFVVSSANRRSTEATSRAA